MSLSSLKGRLQLLMLLPPIYKGVCMLDSCAANAQFQCGIVLLTLFKTLSFMTTDLEIANSSSDNSGERSRGSSVVQACLGAWSDFHAVDQNEEFACSLCHLLRLSAACSPPFHQALRILSSGPHLKIDNV